MSNPPQSEAIIASLIDEVQKSNAPFDVNILIGVRESKHSEKSVSHSPKGEKKEKRHKEKKSKKSKKSSWKRTPSRSPSERKKRHRDRHHSSSSRHHGNVDEPQPVFSSAIPVESKMEKISDDEDDLPMGADFLTVGTDSTKSTEVDSATGSALSPVMNTGTNKRREFVPVEEVFPISKKVRRERSESPPLERNKRPLSQILAKVRAKKDATLVPRNIKLKQDGKSGGVDDVCSNKTIKENSTLIAKSSANKEQRAEDMDSEEYGPRVVLPCGPLPISEDEDDEMQLTHSVVVEKKQPGVIKIASLSERTIAAVKSTKLQIGDDGEVPVSEASGPSTSSNEKAFRSVEARNGDMWDRDRSLANRERAEKKGASDGESVAESSRLNRKDSRSKKKRKKKKREKEKRKHLESVSSSSDSEKKWKVIEKKAKVQRGPISSTLGEHSRLYSDRLEEERDERKASRRDDDRKRRLSHRSSDASSTAVAGRSRDRHRRSSGQGARSGNSRRSEGKLVSTLRRPNRGRFRRHRNSFRKRSRSRTRSKSRSRPRSGSSLSSERSRHSRSRSRRSYSRERRHRRDRRRRNTDEKSDDHKIDKKKLLEIAQRNAAQMAQIGGLPNATPEIGGGIAQIGGQSVDQLVDFCQKLQRSQEKAERREKGEEVSSDEDEIASMKKRKSEDDTDFVKHPFALKPSAPITINIANAIPLPIKTPAQRTIEETQLRICYPVSSGQQHREKDVTTGSALPEKGSSYRLPPPPPPPLLAPVTSESASNSTNVSSNPPPTSSSPTNFLGCLPPPPPPPELHLQDSTDADTAGPSGLQSARAQSDDGSVFQEPAPALLAKTPANVGRVLARRVQAKKRLAEDPNDVEAMNMLKEADDQMNAWAASKYVVGQFTGTTGVNILTAEQLAPDDPRYSAWAKKEEHCELLEHVSYKECTKFGGNCMNTTDLFKSANKVTGGVGHKLMQKMGWTPGEGLGKDRDGPLEPLTLDVKSDRKGLVSTDELPPPKKPHAVVSVDVAGKHPVSMLMEICSKRHWSPPQFTCIESGPSNNRRFMWKAVVNGIEYEPLTTSTSKKTGKAQVCEVVLQSLGFKQGDSPSW